MQHMYVNVDTHATINLMHFDDATSMITGVEVLAQNRGQGHARTLIQDVLRDADAQGVTLMLSVQPDGTGLKDDQLTAWYARLGFVPYCAPGETTPEPQAMTRPPRLAVHPVPA